MANIEFDGAYKDISEEQLNYIAQVFKERDFEGQVSVESVGGAGENYVANVKRFTATKNGEQFKIVAKIAPQNEKMRQNMQTVVMFRNEFVMYTEVLPKFTELEIAAGIPEKERFRYAECYGTKTEEPYEVILLEDLKESSFVMFDKFKSLSKESVELVLKNFAKLHSLSFVLKEQDLEKYTESKSKLFNIWKLANLIPQSVQYFQHLAKVISGLLDKDEYRSIITDRMGNLAKNAYEILTKESEYSIIYQGDAWTNNIMFSLEDGKPVQCCMIDYQLSSEASPALDLQYMIFNCTDHATRVNNYHQWIDYYHSELQKRLSLFRFDIDSVYPRSQLDEDLKSFAKLAFGLSFLVSVVTLREASEASSFIEATKQDNIEEFLAQSEFDNFSSKTTEIVKDRLEGLIESFKEFDLL